MIGVASCDTGETSCDTGVVPCDTGETSCDTGGIPADTQPLEHRSPTKPHVENGLERKLVESLISSESEIAAQLEKTDITVDREATACNVLASEPANNRNSVELKVN